MARKSRKNIMPQSAAPEIRISEEVNLLRTAAYARLSSENSGHETEDTLNTQILQIHNYIKEHPELTGRAEHGIIHSMERRCGRRFFGQ